ncbi:sulfate permease [Thozetella sp. PMI_491]|nr:sulfate permease [Thozetella sp. PMI_491]
MGKSMDFVTKRVLGIDSRARDRQVPPQVENFAREAFSEVYLEDEPSVREWLRSLVPTRKGAIDYFLSLLPCIQWIPRYNLRWLLGDATAGVTIGLVIVPQAMAYALLAGLSPEYGLYTSFVGAAIYWLFGTSRDIVVGTTAVGSLLVGSAIISIEEQRGDEYSREEIAKAVSVVGGAILLFLGLFRLGWIIEFIPYVPISAFITSASITIMSSQFPTAMGITGVNTREAPYLVIINTLKALGRTKVDASIGLSTIVILFAIRHVCAMMEVSQPSRKRLWAAASSMRLTFVMLLFTLISWLLHRTGSESETHFRIVGTIEPGFKHAGVPRITTDLVSLVLPELPPILIILIIEHIAIAKAFGRSVGYTIVPSQEIMAQGASNILGSFVGGYACTGSFGASAVLSKAGVRTPFAGLVGALMLVLALYALTAVFYYIPMAALAGSIIHAVCNLITPPKTLYRYWLLSPLELIIWLVGVILAMFTGLETSIYVTIGLSLAIVLIRMARTKGQFLGRVDVYHATADGARTDSNDSDPAKTESSASTPLVRRAAFLPIDHQDGSNPTISMESPHPGIFVYRFAEGLNYINQAQHLDLVRTYIISHTRRTTPDDNVPLSDRLWCSQDPSKRSGAGYDSLPYLRAVVLDFSAVNNIDVTSVNGLVDLRNTLDAHAKPAVVEWHISGLTNRWTRRALAVAGFGYPPANNPAAVSSWIPVYASASLASGAIETTAGQSASRRSLKATDCEAQCTQHDVGILETPRHEEAKADSSSASSETSDGNLFVPVHGADRPFFHLDVIEAVDAAVRDAKGKN